MSNQASFALRSRNPDVLTCIANLSNDEVFTPPEFANRMLDTLAEAWAANHMGANLWADQTVKFLDPCTKSGVFLREITSRLTQGLEQEIPDLQKRVNHILTRQVFGIGITQITSLLARRSVYCSKHANGEHSIAKSFASDEGNIWFKRTKHTWDEGRCRYCGAPREIFERGSALETHAYAFIHTDNIKIQLTDIFGGNMQFEVIIGNPPYQMTDAAGGGVDASIYHLFVDQAKRLDPKFVCMVIPSRWMAGGRGVGDFDGFRSRMLGDHGTREVVDWEVMSEAFPGVDFEGGVCYFLWDKHYKGSARVKTIRGDSVVESNRMLDEFDVFVRDSEAVGVLRKVLAHGEKSISEILTNTEPFKFESNFTGYSLKKRADDLPMYLISGGKRIIGYVRRDEITKNLDLIDTWKVLVARGYGERGAKPANVLGKPWIAPRNSVCTGSFMFFYVGSEAEAKSLQSYFATKFFRFLVSLRKITQNAFRSTYTWVPAQSWNQTWTDKALFKKYKLTQQEIDYIDSVIKPMDLSATAENE